MYRSIQKNTSLLFKRSIRKERKVSVHQLASRWFFVRLSLSLSRIVSRIVAKLNHCISFLTHLFHFGTTVSLSFHSLSLCTHLSVSLLMRRRDAFSFPISADHRRIREHKFYEATAWCFRYHWSTSKWLKSLVSHRSKH